MTTTNHTEIQELQAFATAHGEIQFAHLCTAAIEGEEWAVVRVSTVLEMIDGRIAATTNERTLYVIRATDTTRPDGAIARALEV